MLGAEGDTMLIRLAFHVALLSLFAVTLFACTELHPLPTLRIDRDGSSEVRGDASAFPEVGADAATPTDAPAVPDAAPLGDEPVIPPDGTQTDTQSPDAPPDVAQPPDAAAPTDTAVPVDMLPVDAGSPVDVTCSSGFERCNGVCVDTFSHTDHCGVCGRACAFPGAVAVCRSATCVILRCEAGRANCDGDPNNGCEVDVQTSRDHCGMCGASCAAFAHVCTDGECLEDRGFQAVAPCLRESDYVRGDAVRFASGGYTPRCLRVRRGNVVSFTADFAEHPLVGASGASMPNAIPYLAGAPQAMPWTQTVMVDRAGYFPFRCNRHPEETGVVWVE